MCTICRLFQAFGPNKPACGSCIYGLKELALALKDPAVAAYVNESAAVAAGKAVCDLILVNKTLEKIACEAAGKFRK